MSRSSFSETERLRWCWGRPVRPPRFHHAPGQTDSPPAIDLGGLDGLPIRRLFGRACIRLVKD